MLLCGICGLLACLLGSLIETAEKLLNVALIWKLINIFKYLHHREFVAELLLVNTWKNH